MADRFKFIPSCYLLLIRDGKILLSCRANTGFQDGNWGLPSGHFEGDESASAATAREVQEEVGLVIPEQDLQCVHVMHRRGGPGQRKENERIDFFFTPEKWTGEPINAEPDKCSAIEWFPLDQLPENTIDYVRKAIGYYTSGVQFSEYGW